MATTKPGTLAQKDGDGVAILLPRTSADLVGYIDETTEQVTDAATVLSSLKQGQTKTEQRLDALETGKADKDHTHSAADITSGTLAAERGGTGRTDGKAVALASARTIQLTGDVTGSVSFDGSADQSLAATLAASGVAADTYGPEADQSPAAGGTIDVPSVTVDVKGRVTAAATRKITIPAAGATETASKLKTARTIDGVSFDGSANVSHYAECSTAAGTAAKTVSLDNFSLVAGARVLVRFTITNTASAPTLNVNGTGAKAIQYRGSAISAGHLAANRVKEFVYTGSAWEVVGDQDSNTTYDIGDTSTDFVAVFEAALGTGA